MAHGAGTFQPAGFNNTTFIRCNIIVFAKEGRTNFSRPRTITNKHPNSYSFAVKFKQVSMPNIHRWTDDDSQQKCMYQISIGRTNVDSRTNMFRIFVAGRMITREHIYLYIPGTHYFFSSGGGMATMIVSMYRLFFGYTINDNYDTTTTHAHDDEGVEQSNGEPTKIVDGYILSSIVCAPRTPR